MKAARLKSTSSASSSASSRTTPFPHDHFVKYIIERTKVDGSDLALHLAMIFETLNKPEAKRLTIIDEQLKAFPFVDGGLFEERLETAAFDSAMREARVHPTGAGFPRLFSAPCFRV